MSTSIDHAKQKMLQAILSRAASDPSFRSGLLEQPKRTINEAFGLAIPEQFRVRFIEKDADLDALVVLPDLRTDGELSDGDLDVVNGGGMSLFDSGETPW